MTRPFLASSLICFVAVSGTTFSRADDLPPVPVAGSEAKTASEMQPYTEVITLTDVKFDMVPIPGGKFTMGSPPDEPGRSKKLGSGPEKTGEDSAPASITNKEHDEGPQHEVEIEPFWMGKCEVTWEEFDVFVNGFDLNNGRARKQTLDKRELYAAEAVSGPTLPYGDPTWGMGKQGGYPAVNMTHFAARMYCKWLSAKTGRYYRLPTEAEWEYACRAGTKTAYSFGDDPKELGDYAWFFGNANEAYKKVGQKKPNPFGLYDMHGNVSEWVLDQYAHYPPAKGFVANPVKLPTQKDGHVVRGGSWIDDPETLRSAARRKSDLEEWQSQDTVIPKSVWILTDAPFVGFRVVRPLREPSEQEKKEKWDAGMDAEAKDGEFVERIKYYK